MHDLAPLNLASPSVLSWKAARIPAKLSGDFEGLHLKVPPGREGDVIGRFRLPGPLAASKVGNIDALWLGPGEWLVFVTKDLRELSELQGRLGSAGIASVRCGSRLCLLELEAEAELLAGLTGLVPDALGPGRAARTRLADIPVTLTASTEGAMRLIFERSYAPHLRAWLDSAI